MSVMTSMKSGPKDRAQNPSGDNGDNTNNTTRLPITHEAYAFELVLSRILVP